FGFVGGGFTTSYGHRTHLNNLLLVMETDEGLIGYGEICRKSGNTLEPIASAFTSRIIGLLGAAIGADPLNLAEARHRLGPLPSDITNLGAAFETACLDLAARVADVPLWKLLGGRFEESVPIYRSISQGPSAAMADETRDEQIKGCRVIQMKVAGEADPEKDQARIQAILDLLEPDSCLLVDANGGWDVDKAVAAMACFTDNRIFWEEPCRTYTENRECAELSGAMIILDQCLTGPDVSALACAEGAVAGLGVKCTVQGGVERARLTRDLAIAHNLKIKVDDSWSADVASAASLHLAMAVPPENLLGTIDMRDYFDTRLSESGPVVDGYRFKPGPGSGLGFDPDLAGLGPPIAIPA
ncbi:MAG: mandelate racemase/muconate lactonizing enzyme family protein, partial [Pseudomonadota bacterium]